MFQEINSIFSKHILTDLHLKKSPYSHQKNEQDEKVLENDL